MATESADFLSGTRNTRGGGAHVLYSEPPGFHAQLRGAQRPQLGPSWSIWTEALRLGTLVAPVVSIHIYDKLGC